MYDEPRTAPTSDGSNTLHRDSRLGLAVTFVLGIGLDTAITALTNADTSSWHGWWVPFASLAISTAAGALTSYKAKRRVR